MSLADRMDPLPLSVDEDDRERFERQNLASESSIKNSLNSEANSARMFTANQPTSTDDVMIPNSRPADTSDRSYVQERMNEPSLFEKLGNSLESAKDSLSQSLDRAEARARTDAEYVKEKARQDANYVGQKVHEDVDYLKERSREAAKSVDNKMSSSSVQGGGALETSMPLSTDDVMMPQTDYVATSSTSASEKPWGQTINEKLHQAKQSLADRLHEAENRVGGTHTTTHTVVNTTPSGEFYTGNQSGPRAKHAPSTMADNTRDLHLHPGPVALPTHVSHQPITTLNTEPKDSSASSDLKGMIHNLQEKVEAGVDALHHKVDNFTEQHHIRSDQPRMMDSRGKIPTLMDQNNARNNAQVAGTTGAQVPNVPGSTL